MTTPARRCLLGLGLWLWLVSSCMAGVMDAAAMRRAFPSPLVVGEREARLPVWPLFKQEATATVLVGYAFESIDLAPIPGFSGTPINLLVLLDAQGRFAEVRVLSQHEPVFLDGLGPEPLGRFVAQYQGLSLKQNIKVGSANGGNRSVDGAARASGANVTIDGVAKATASVRILNQSLLAASLKVARDKLGYAPGRDPALIARVRPDVQAVMDWPALRRAGLVVALQVPQAAIDRAFEGTVGEGVADADLVGADQGADTPFLDVAVAWLSAPAVGRNLLGERGWAHLQSRLEEGDHALLVVSRGRWRYSGDAFVRGAVPDRLGLRQADLPIELRDLDLDDRLALPPEWRDAEAKVFRVIGPAGLDPALPLELALRVTRSKGQIYPERVSRDFTLRYQLPGAYVQAAASDQKTWRAIWVDRAGELVVLVAALGLLTWLLARPRWLVAHAGRLARVRVAYLLFTLGFIGWYAQGQLSIVNLTALLQALVAGRGLGFFLYDPMTVLLWAFVVVTLVVWGRATFCGWLCPFGALQELVSRLTLWLGLRRRPLHRRLDAALKRVKYGLLALILLTACLSGPWTDRVVELEPFKTAITLGFVRAWPYVAWAALLVLSSAWVYKGFCRYLCPLGAGLAVLGRLRRVDWIARRVECGQPCQTCRHRCEYQAIQPSGQIDYAECFQCLDCVAIYESPQRCAPQIALARHGRAFTGVTPRVIPIHVAAAQPGEAA